MILLKIKSEIFLLFEPDRGAFKQIPIKKVGKVNFPPFINNIKNEKNLN